MKKAKIFQKYLPAFFQALLFLFVLAVFFLSLFKIINYMGILKTDVWGFSFDGNKCGICEWGKGFCQRGHEWCFRCWPPCPKPTPTPPCEPTPTPTLPPEATPTPPCEVTPTPTSPPEEPTSPPSKATPTPTPTSPPAVGGPPEPGGPPVCGAAIPPAPTLLSVTPSGTSEADLVWTAVTPVTHYLIAYGFSSRNYIYGVDNTGNVTFYTVGGLDPATDYCFAVRAVNDCAPSELSNEICTGAPVGQVLGVTTLADTGSLDDEIFEILFIIGCVCLSLGLRKNFPREHSGSGTQQFSF